ncbi:GNAT family N-acetyltransferase [Chitinophaga lutea]
MEINSGLLEKWQKGWSLSRELPLPTPYGTGFFVAVDQPMVKARYVFADLSDDVSQLAETIHEPWVFIKVCVSPEALLAVVPPRWVLQPQGYVMTCFQPMKSRDIRLGEDYRIEAHSYDATTLLNIIDRNGKVAAEGRVVIVEDMAVYDRISTEEAHKRKGLGTILMLELEKIALVHGVRKNILVATDEGRLLYASLGWEMNALYSSVVIQA